MPDNGLLVSGDEYRTVTFIMQRLNVDSVALTKDPVLEPWKFCPRSLIHGGDDFKLIRMQHNCPCEVTVRMFEWKADELHLA